VPLSGAKTLTATNGEALNVAAGQFSFILDVTTNPDNGCMTTLPKTVNVAAGGTIGFGELTFVKAGTYIFTVREAIPSPVPDGWTYDEGIVTVTIVVTENAGGTALVAGTPSYSKDIGSANGIIFANEYEPGEATGSLQVVKEIVPDNKWEEGEEFKFTVTFEVDGEDLEGLLDEIESSFGGTGDIVYDDETAKTTSTWVVWLTWETGKQSVLFTKIPLGTEYRVEESDHAGFTCVEPSNKVKTGVIEEKPGEPLMIVVTYVNKRDTPPEPPPPEKTQASITVTKETVGAPSTYPTFNFVFEGEGERQTWQTNGPGSHTFTVTGLEAGKTYTYRIYETGGATNWTYDTTTRVVTITVSDSLYVSVYITPSNSLTFTNRYTPPPPPETEPPTERETAPPPTTRDRDRDRPTTTPQTNPPTTTPQTNPPGTNPPTTLPPTTEPPITDPVSEPETEPYTEPATEPETEPYIEPPTEPETVTEPEEVEEVEEIRIPLANGWYAVPLGDDMYEIFDENGVPLGVIHFEGDIEDWNDWDSLIPLISMTPEPPKSNPPTGDDSFPIFFGMLAVTSVAAALVIRKKSKYFVE
jgi:pilin isopeptide linkage protein